MITNIQLNINLVCLCLLGIFILSIPSNFSVNAASVDKYMDLSSPTHNEQPQTSVDLELIGQIGGRVEDVEIKDSFAYAAIGLRLVILDISEPTSPLVLGSTAPFSQLVEGVAVSGTLAYVADGRAGLKIVDVSDPYNPVHVGTYNALGYTEEVDVAHNYAYIADGNYGLCVVDISDPMNPVEKGNTYSMNYVFDVAVVGQYVFLAAGGAGLLLADISDPNNPKEISDYNTTGFAYGITHSKNRAYVADAWEGVRIIDTSDPANLHEKGSLFTPGWSLDVEVLGACAYVADGKGGLRVFNISELEDFSEVIYHETPGIATKVAVQDGLAYVADNSAGLQVIGITNHQDSPAKIEIYNPISDARRLTVQDRYAFIAAGFNGLRIIDLFDPSHPKYVATYETQGGYASDVVVDGNYAYLSSYVDAPCNLHVLDISNPAHPERIGSLHTGGAFRDIAFDKPNLYVADEWGLRIISLKDPTAPTQIGFIRLNQNKWDTVGIEVSGKLAYVADHADGMKIVDVSDPTSPRLVGVYNSPGATSDVAVEDGRAYVSDAHGGLRIVDVSCPNNPSEIGSWDTPGTAQSVAISGMTAYISDGGGGLHLLDITNPRNPTLIDTYDTVGHTWQSTVKGEYIYIADGHSGLLILKETSVARSGQVNMIEFANKFKNGLNSRNQRAPSPAYNISNYINSDSANYQGSIQNYMDSCVYKVNMGSDLDIIPSESQIMVNKEFLPSALAASKVNTNNYPFSRSLTTQSSQIFIVTNTQDSGPGTLRQALLDAGAGDEIKFDPTVFPPANASTILLQSQLPSLDQGNLLINGRNTGVILDGRATSAGTVGLLINSNGNTIQGLEIMDFPAEGIKLTGNARRNIIGGDRTEGKGPTGEGNVISGNGQWSGLQIYGSENTIKGNLIGTNSKGTNIKGNVSAGIGLSGQSNIVGGTAVGEGNIVSGNQVGISIQGENAIDNKIIGNLIGTDITGMKALGNDHGIIIHSQATYNRIGGTKPGEGNIISGNIEKGVNIIRKGTAHNIIVGNFIGTDITGENTLGNGRGGVVIESGAWGNRVGGNTPGERNVISGNDRYGVIISDPNTTHNVITGNFIGTGYTGTKALGNHCGILIWTSGYNRVGGTQKGEQNIISANDRGISIGGIGFTDNLILGNHLGTDVTGHHSLGNKNIGISINQSTQHNFIGGTTRSETNLISDNNSIGIRIKDAGVANNFIIGNLLGTDISGVSSLGESYVGISLEDSSLHNSVQGNTIAFHKSAGIQVKNSFYNTLRANSIHTNKDGGIIFQDNGNNLLPPPVIKETTAGSVSGTACSGCYVEVFTDEDDQGQMYEGYTIAKANGNWAWKGSLTLPNVTATATDAFGNTSTFSVAKKTSVVEPDIKANDSNDPIKLPSITESISIITSFNYHDYPKRTADWWIASYNLSGWKSFVIDSESSNWEDGIKRCIEMPFINFDSIQIPTPPLSKGKNIIFFAVDDNADGKPDATWFDYVEVNIE